MASDNLFLFLALAVLAAACRGETVDDSTAEELYHAVFASSVSPYGPSPTPYGNQSPPPYGGGPSTYGGQSPPPYGGQSPPPYGGRPSPYGGQSPPPYGGGPSPYGGGPSPYGGQSPPPYSGRSPPHDGNTGGGSSPLFPPSSPSPAPSSQPGAPANPSASPSPVPSASPVPSPSPGNSPGTGEFSISPSPTTTEATCAGVAYDGYLSECTIIFETSDDGHTAAFKPTTTVHGGLFSLPGYVAADLGNAYLQPAPRNITQTVTSDDAGICFDTALQMPEYLPLAAPPPSTCNNAIIISPLTSLLVYGQVYGLTADNVKTALGIPTSVALGTVDVLKGALALGPGFMPAYVAEMNVKSAVAGAAGLLASSADKYQELAVVAFKSLALMISDSIAASGRRRLQAATVDLTTSAAITSLLQSAQSLAVQEDPSSINPTVTPAILQAVANALAAINSVAATATSAVDVQKAGLVASTTLATAIQNLVSGTISLSTFTTSTSVSQLTNDVQTAVIPGNLSNTGSGGTGSSGGGQAQKSNAVAIGVGVGLGLGLPIIAAAALGYYWRFVRPGRVGSHIGASEPML